MKVRFFSDEDDWQTDGRQITDPSVLAAVRKVLEDEGPVIVEHAFYRGARSPSRRVFEDYEDFIAYLESAAAAGDIINVWNFWALCQDTNRLAHGKCPDDRGRVPKRGAY